MPPIDETSGAPRPTPRSAPKAFGTLVPGYEIVREIARGGMGVVYEARDSALKRTVALKMTLSGGAASEEELERFRREARALASLSHPNVVQVYGFGDVDGLPWFALEYCTGGTLATRLKNGPLPVSEAVSVVATLASTVAAVHRRGITHRDLKPANVLFDGEGTLKVADFGLVRDAEGGGTLSGSMLGTPAYMALEQARGETRSVGPHSDVYALGAILYECLTGRPPFVGGNAQAVLAQVLTGSPPVPRLRTLRPEVSAELEAVCWRCLEREPKARPTSEELAKELRRLTAGPAKVGRPNGSPWVLLVVACVMLLAAGLAALAVWLVLHAPGRETVIVEVTKPVPMQETKPAQETRPEVTKPATKPEETKPSSKSAEVTKPVEPTNTEVTKKDPPKVTPTPEVTPKVQPKPLKSPTSEEAKAGQQAWVRFLDEKSVEKEIDIGGEKLTVVLIPAGTLTMGSDEYESEKPLHEVTIPRAFWLGKYEVTQAQYKAVTGETPSSFCATGSQSERVKGMNTDRFPVENVSWEDADAFCVKVSKHLGRRITLPTEAQWEWACRAGTSTPFSFGKELNGTQANCDGTIPFGTAAKGDYLLRTTQVGTYSKYDNAFGLSDMHGNVYEWCRDWYATYPAPTPKGSEDGPEVSEKPETSDARVLRGGSWCSNAVYCRSAPRYRFAPADRSDLVGFRVCLLLD